AGWRGLFSWMKIFRFAAPFLFVYLPYFLIRWRAYGDLFPNTYYAKSGGSSYWSQGGIYLWSFLVGSGGWLWLTALLPLGLLRLSQRGHQGLSRSEVRRTQGSAASTLKLYCAIAIPLFSLYVAKVGGDFMLYRFLVVLLPLALLFSRALSLELSKTQPTGGRRARLTLLSTLTLSAVSLAAAATPIELIPERTKWWHLSNEESYYPLKERWPPVNRSHYRRYGEKTEALLGELSDPPPVAVYSVGLIAYHAPSVPFVDLFGLTNRTLARKRIKRRGRPGHEKIGRRSEAIESGAVLSRPDFYGAAAHPLTEIRGQGIKLYLLQEAPALLAALRENSTIKLPLSLEEVFAAEQQAFGRELALSRRAFLWSFLSEERRVTKLTAQDRALGLITDFESPLAAHMTLEGEGLKVSNQSAQHGVSGSRWLLGQPGRGRFTVDLGASEKARDLSFRWSGAKTGAALTIRVDGVLRMRLNPPGEGRLKTISVSLPAGAATLELKRQGGGPLLFDRLHWLRSTPLQGARDRWSELSSAQRAEAVWAAMDELPEASPLRADIEARAPHRWHFEGGLPEETEAKGAAFKLSLARGGVRKRLGNIRGHRGERLIDSSLSGFDASGTLTFPPVKLGAGGVSFRFGGRGKCNQVFVELISEGERLARRCVNGDTLLSPITLKKASAVGREVQLRLVDRSKRGFMLFDEVIWWSPLVEPESPSAQ
ncbi:MAG: hypothetical protein VYD19_04120, partial [Myxococcota bacterium]|nr:hypothetical protein [Myxococcota bacterium]